MGKKDPRIDAYIKKAAPFAQPILRHLRKVVHAGCPDVEETMKWSMPHFNHHGIMCGMAAFKAHATFGFWKGRIMFGKEREREAMGQFGRITSIDDLPAEKTLLRYVQQAAKLNEKGVSMSTRKTPRKPRGEAKVPDDLQFALKNNARARKTFRQFSASHRREYVEWISEAKREETRSQRLETALEWMSEGKARNWKYQR